MLWLSRAPIIGASLTGWTVNIKLFDSVYSPSDTEYETTIEPLKSALGIITTLVPSTSTLAFPSTEAPKYTWSPSISLADNSTVKEKSSSISWSATTSKTGASLIGITVNVNVVLSENSKSETVTEISTSPLKSCIGVIVNWSPSTLRLVSPLDAENTKSSPSISNADSVIISEVSSSVTWSAIESIIGASLTGLIWIVIYLVSDDKLPSVTLYSIVSIPFKSSFATYVAVRPSTVKFPSEIVLKTNILKSSSSLSTSDTGKSNTVEESSSIIKA